MTQLIRRVLMLVGLVIVVSACTFKAPQLESAVSQFRAAVTPNNTAENVVWLASFNGQGAVLKPYLVEGYTVFANESGDAVSFDGWVVRSVLGFGREHAISVIDKDGVRSSASYKMRFEALCSEWQKLATQGGYQWRQNCGSNGFETVIDIDETDTIHVITQGFGDLGELKLQSRR
jgi:hypothetical protein